MADGDIIATIITDHITKTIHAYETDHTAGAMAWDREGPPPMDEGMASRYIQQMIVNPAIPAATVILSRFSRESILVIKGAIEKPESALNRIRPG